METGELITGDSNGNIYVWGRGQNKISRAIQGAHEGPVFSVCVLKDGHLVSGGGKDRRIVHWDAAFNRSGQEAELPALYGSVRTLSSGPGNTIFVGTTKNCLLQVRRQEAFVFHGEAKNQKDATFSNRFLLRCELILLRVPNFSIFKLMGFSRIR